MPYNQQDSMNLNKKQDPKNVGDTQQKTATNAQPSKNTESKGSFNNWANSSDQSSSSKR